jgi:2-polyprenyl-6-methoxyphenol hydroxylase-like FAD-dependent oxidoreductase
MLGMKRATTTTNTLRRQGSAVVIGGSLAGLLAARVLSDYFEHVTIVERGTLGDDARSAVPQASHTHVLLLRGREIMERLLPGLEAEVLARGAPLSDSGLHSLSFGRYGWLPRWRTGLLTFAASRHLLDGIVRRRVLALPNVKMCAGYEVSGLLVENDTVYGVRMHRRVADATKEQIVADFVVDASGRSSRVPAWFAEHGFPRPPETVIDAHVGYATRWYRRPADLDLGWKTLTVQSLSPEVPRGGVVVEMERNQLAVTLLGAAGDYPPTDEDEFLAFARTLRHPLLYDTIKHLEPLSPVYGYRRNENKLVHYDRAARFPEHLAVVGDAACGFNPTYGQGMTVAALGAETLQAAFQEQRRRYPNGELQGLGRRFQRRLAQVIAPAWELATGEDARYPTTEGAPRPTLLSRLSGYYIDRLAHRMTTRTDLAQTFLEVIHMVKPPAALFHPRMIAATFGWIR